MSHRRRSRAVGSPPGDAGPAPTPEKSGRIQPWAVLGSDRRVLALALAFRAANALLVRAYFNPDEHWQCLEVAHRVAFGDKCRFYMANCGMTRSQNILGVHLFVLFILVSHSVEADITRIIYLMDRASTFLSS